MSAALQLPSSFDGIAAIAWTLEPPDPREKKDVLRNEAGFLLDGLLVRVARSQGALDVAIGELLADVGTGDRALRLGFSRVGDYAASGSASPPAPPRSWSGSPSGSGTGPSSAKPFAPAKSPPARPRPSSASPGAPAR